MTPILFSPRPTTLSSIAVETNNARKPADDAAREKQRTRKQRERETEKEKITRRRKNVKGKRKERERESRQQADELLDPAYPAYCVADDQ